MFQEWYFVVSRDYVKRVEDWHGVVYIYIMSQTNENANKIINEHNLHFPLMYTRRTYTLS